MGSCVNAVTKRLAVMGTRLVPIMAVLLLMLPVSTAQAATPLGVHVDIQTTFGDPSYGPFVATGPAVDAGLVCGEGDTLDIGVKVAGAPGRLILQVLKQFTCSDGSGSFVLKFQLRVDDRLGRASSSWNVESGTGAYGSLQGTGTAYGLPVDDSTAHDELFGTLH
jgi:hypothetical protein